MGSLFPSSEHGRRRRDRLLALFFLFASLVLIERAGRKHHGVLLVNQGFGERFLEHRDPYFDPSLGERVHGPYPPSYALVCAPLSLVPTPIARRLWCGLQVGALFVLYRLLRRRLRLHRPELARDAPAYFLFALLLVSRFLLRDMKAGGGNLLYGTLALAGIEASLAGRERLGAVPIALGLVLKPNLAPLLLFFALRERWRTLGWTLGLAAALFLAPGLYFGWGEYLSLVQGWGRGVFAFAALPDLHDSTLVPAGLPPARFAMNQSLREAVFRWLRPPGDSGAYDVHLFGVSAGTAIVLGRVLAVALLAAVARAARRARRGLEEWAAALAFFPLSLLLSPITWKAHLAVLVPIAFLFVVRARTSAGTRLRNGLVVAYVLLDATGTDLVGDRAGDWLQATSLVTVGVLAALVVLLALLRRAEAAPLAGSGLL